MAKHLYRVSPKEDVLDICLVIAKSPAQAVRYIERREWDVSRPTPTEVAVLVGKMGIEVEDATAEPEIVPTE